MGDALSPVSPERCDELSLLAYKFVGEFFRSSSHSGALLDFEQLDFRPDGTYAARVEATLLNPGVRSFGTACTLPEEGVWNAYAVCGQTRIRVRPTTGRARVYGAAMVGGHLTLSRRGERTMLFLGDRLSLANPLEARQSETVYTDVEDEPSHVITASA